MLINISLLMLMSLNITYEDAQKYYLCQCSLTRRMCYALKYHIFADAQYRYFISEFNKDIAAAFSNVENLDLDSLVKFFNSTITLILDKHAPLKTVTVTPRNKNPWFTPNLLTERRKRRQLERTWRNSCNEADRLLYKN